MSVKPLQLVQARRVFAAGGSESLDFEPGVNVIVGEPNTGKSRWCRTIDYVLGDIKKVEEKLSEPLADKFSTASVTLKIGDEEFTAERRWREPGARGKVFVGEKSYLAAEFQHLLMEKLGIPIVHYPLGTPYGPKTWPELSFRSLLRHMYRRQKPWADIADGQYGSEQHACIVQFFGMAENLFSEEYGEMVQKEKRITDLKQRKEQFLETLFEVSRGIVDEQAVSAHITEQSIDEAIGHIETEVQDLDEQRRNLITKLAAKLESENSNNPSPDFISRQSKEFGQLKERERVQLADLERVDSRIAEVQQLEEQVAAELNRLERARDAGVVLADLKATHCPVCDQRIKVNGQAGECYLCHQPLAGDAPPTSDPLHRLTFELDRLKVEKKELGDLLTTLIKTREKHVTTIRSLRSQAAQLAELLKPVRLATAAIVSPELAALEVEVGRRVERIEQLRRIRASLATQELITKQIADIQARVDELENEVNKRNASLDFETPSDLMTAGMNDYTSKLVVSKEKMWKQQPIRFTLNKHDVRIRVGKQKWDAQLGETNTIYCLLAYHYALLATSDYENSRYPKFLMLELPGEVEGQKVADKENFVIEPFIELCKKDGFEEAQVIATGSAFEGLKGARRIELREVWTGAPNQVPEPDGEE